MVTKLLLVVGTALMVAGSGMPLKSAAVSSSSQELLPADLDRILAPVALYPDQLLAQMLLCAADPVSLVALDDFLKKNPALKGTELQDAALKAKFEPSFVALAIFPQVVQQMRAKLDLTKQIGQAFTKDRALVFESIQRLRRQAQNVGSLKDTPQQEVDTQTTASGQQVIVIEPANPQVVYVPQYNPQVVYTQPTTSTVVVQQESSGANAAAAALIGFTAGIAIGAAVDNDYYYGPYGWGGAPRMYNDAWDDYYDHREDAREDWMDHREDLTEERSDRAENAREQRTDRTEARTDSRSDRTASRSDARAEGTGTAAASRSTASTAASTRSSGSTYANRGHTESQAGNRAATQARSGTRSDAFSGYSSGRSERAASSRGQSSRASSRSRGGGGSRRR
jgi:hypothetical protein